MHNINAYDVKEETTSAQTAEKARYRVQLDAVAEEIHMIKEATSLLYDKLQIVLGPASAEVKEDSPGGSPLTMLEEQCYTVYVQALDAREKLQNLLRTILI